VTERYPPPWDQMGEAEWLIYADYLADAGRDREAALARSAAPAIGAGARLVLVTRWHLFAEGRPVFRIGQAKWDAGRMPRLQGYAVVPPGAPDWRLAPEVCRWWTWEYLAAQLGKIPFFWLNEVRLRNEVGRWKLLDREPRHRTEEGDFNEVELAWRLAGTPADWPELPDRLAWRWLRRAAEAHERVKASVGG
jgi:hypothetical protein